MISVAAELSGMHPQTLRQYDRLGLVTPQRTRGRGRRYSARDIARLREVQGDHFTLIDPTSAAWHDVRDALPDLLAGRLPS